MVNYIWQFTKQLAMFRFLLHVVITLIASSSVGLSQISVVNIAAPTQRNLETKTYDSLSNYLSEDIYRYKNQELYLMPKSENYHKNGFEGFYVDYKVAPQVNNSNIYKGDGMAVSSYNAIQGKYFKVLNVHISQPSARNKYQKEKNSFYLELQEKESRDIVYYELNTKFEYGFPFLVTGYFEKQKELLVGKNIIVGGENWNSKETPMSDIRTGIPVSFERGSKWKCIDLAIDGRYFYLSLILENENKEQITLPMSRFQSPIFRRKAGVYLHSDVLNYTKKFGAENWELIYNNTVKIGFTEEMVKLSLGEPEKINHSSSGDQWVYENQYLYFEAGKLKSYN